MCTFFYLLLKLHIPEEGISALSNELLDSFENSNLELIAEKKADQTVAAGSCAEVVADHYNNIEEKGVHERKESRIFHMRNLNNWIKSRLIGITFLLLQMILFKLKTYFSFLSKPST